MHGSAVYVLSDRGVNTEQARWLANRENAADLVGGVELQGKDSDLATVLLDLSQNATMEASFDVGTRSEEHTSELQSLMRISYAVFCLKKKNKDSHKQ